jgi:uncharacterized protein (DUF1800 family)
LALFWVGDAPSSALVDRLAARFLARDGRIAEVLKLLFEETEFKASLGQRFKDPLHYIYSAVRAGFDGEVIVNSGFVINLLNRLGQGLFARQTPDGFPLESRAWNGGGQLTTRFEVARNLVNNGGNMFKPDPANLAAAAGPASGSSSTMGSSPAASPTPLPQAHPRGELFDALIAPKLSAATRAALAAAKPKDADALWFSSPEFMLR